MWFGLVCSGANAGELVNLHVDLCITEMFLLEFVFQCIHITTCSFKYSSHDAVCRRVLIFNQLAHQ